MENQNEKNPARSVGGEESAPRQSGYGKRPSYRRGSRPGATQSATARNEKREVLSDTETSRAVREDRRSASQSVRGRSMSRSQGQVTVTRSGERKWGDTTGGADGRGRTDAVSDGRLAGARDTSRRGRGTVTDNAGGQSRLQRSEDNSGNEGENLSRNRQNPRSRSGDTRSRQNSAGGRLRDREAADMPDSGEEEVMLKENFFVSPDYTSRNKLLDDTFSPLHEADIYDPEAEAAAKRILDAEGPLLFREETKVTEAAEPEEKEVPTEMVEIVGVRFKKPGKVYYFSPGEWKLSRGMNVIVETARGAEFGEVWIPNGQIPASDIVIPLRPIIRVATPEDARHNEENRDKEQKAFTICQEKIAAHGLDMKLVETQYTFDNSKLLFYFTSDGRVDFRELVKDLAGVFRTRIELRQIGIRDEAKLLGGLGACGRPLCCASFLSDFVQVSIKMAKEQNLSLNSTKISGCCGRLMCCLRYEADTYEEEIRRTPTVGTQVRTPEGNGSVVASHPLKGMVDVRLSVKDGEAEVKTFHRDQVEPLRREEMTEKE